MAAPTATSAAAKTPRLPRAAALGRSTFPYVAAAIFAAVIMAWYFFVVVPAKLDYFVGLRFRTLAVSAAQVKSKVESLKASLDGAVAPLASAVGPGTDIFLDKTAKYLSTLIPDLQPSRRSGPGLDLLPDSTLPSIPTTVPWPDVVASAAAASRRDFDDLMLATKDGVVVWQRERTTHRVGNIRELLSTEPAASKWSFSWQLPSTLPKADLRPLNSSAVLTPVNFGGHASYLFAQSIDIAKGAGIADAPFYLAGVVSSGTLEQQARHVPVALVILVALPILLLFLALPFIKLATLTAKERYSFGDMMQLGLATLCGVGLGASLILGPSATGSEVDGALADLAKVIDERVGDETGRVLQFAAALQRNEPTIKSSGALRPCVSQLDSDETGWANRCGLWEALEHLDITTSRDDADPARLRTGSLELDIAAWVDRGGMQVQKWTTKTAVTTLVSHRPFAHYKDLTNNRTWILRDTSKSPLRFTIEPLRSPTTAEMGFVFASPAVRAEHYFIVNVRPQSLVDAVVPPGYGFAVLGADGSVLFHSEEALSLAENFLAEVDRPDLVRAWSRFEGGVTWSGDYHGRPHRLHMRGMTSFVDCPWRIVTYKESDPVLDAQYQQHNAALRLGALNVLALLAFAGIYGIFSAYRNRSMRDFPLTPGAPTWSSLRVIAVLTAITIALVVYTYFPRANRHVNVLYVSFLLLPVIAAAVAVAARHNRNDETNQKNPNGKSERLSMQWRLVEVALLFTVMGALPAIGLARLAYCVHDTRDAERGLETARRRWETRRARLLDRVREPAYSEATYSLLRGPQGFAHDWRPNDWNDPEPIYSYLTTEPTFRLGDRDHERRASSSSDGQQFLRFVLGWTPASTWEEPSHVLSTSESPQLRLTSRGSDDPSPVFAATLAHGPRLNLLDFQPWVGFFILTGTGLALCWAWRRLTPPSFAHVERLDEQLPLVSNRGDEVLLLIGPPRMKKDETLSAEILRITDKLPADRIQLLTDVTNAQLDSAVARVRCLAMTPNCEAADKYDRLWIHVSNLESQLADSDSRKRLLVFLESLLDKGKSRYSRVLAITTSIDPIANFEEVFSVERQGIYEDAVPEVELNRSSLLLSRFRRCYIPIDCTLKARERWRSWLNYEPEKWLETLAFETHGYEPLATICRELETTQWTSHNPSIEDLARVITGRAQAVYELLWTSCTRSEKLVLIQLAQEGVVNPNCFDVVARLVAKGLVTTQPGLSVFNYTFRRFLRGIERDRVVREWEKLEGSGLWVSAGRIVGSSMLLGGVFFLLTQGMSVQTVLPIVSGTGLFGIPVVRDLLAKVTGGSQKSSAA